MTGPLSRPAAEIASGRKPRLLVVPHIYADDIAVREIELARRLTARFDVFLLKWRDALHVDSSSALLRRARQFATAVRAALRRPRVEQAPDGTTLVEVPVLQPILLHRLFGAERAMAVAQERNHRTLLSVLHDFQITHVLLASELFGVERTLGVKTFFDIVDWFPEEGMSVTRLEAVRARLRGMAQKMDGVFAVSDPLCDKLERDCGIRAIPLPNGADLDRLRGVDPAQVHALRSRLGLDGKYVIGYIGNHGNYTGVDLVVNAFLAARARLPQAALLIVGPAQCWQGILDAHRADGVIATGPVPPGEIATYFNALDLGILAQGKSSGTEFAFQLKVVEYTACRKCVVSTPLCTWQRLRWPNVFLIEPEPAAWADAFVRAATTRWQPEWDTLAEPYDWSVLGEKVAAALLSAKAPGETCAS